MTIINAFQAVRPKGNAVQPAVVRRHKSGRAPGLLPGSTQRAMTLDRNGKPRVPLAPRLNGAFAIESGVGAQAAADKRQALLRGSI